MSDTLSTERRFLFVLWDGGGTVPPDLARARRVAARGHGTVLGALACGVPLVCNSIGRDQGDVAARVSPSEPVSALRTAITQVLGTRA